MRFVWFKNISSRQKKGLGFLFVGLFCFLIALLLRSYHQWQGNTLSFTEAPKQVKEVREEDFPAKILIPRMKIELEVTPAEASGDVWEISDKGASYLLRSGAPGEEGNVIIYGHNKKHLLGPIRWLKEEDEIKVIDQEGEEFLYQVIETKTVTPETIEVLAPTQDATLTLYTCTGFLDQERFVVVAKLRPWSKI